MNHTQTPALYRDKYDEPIRDGDILFSESSDYMVSVFKENEGHPLIENYYETSLDDTITLELGDITEYTDAQTKKAVVVGNIKEIPEFYQNPRLSHSIINEINKELANYNEKLVF